MICHLHTLIDEHPQKNDKSIAEECRPLKRLRLLCVNSVYK